MCASEHVCYKTDVLTAKVVWGNCGVCLQVRAIMTESAFAIEELEELYVLFKVRTYCLLTFLSVYVFYVSARPYTVINCLCITLVLFSVLSTVS